jgi:hypothetical protein
MASLTCLDDILQPISPLLPPPLLLLLQCWHSS